MAVRFESVQSVPSVAGLFGCPIPIRKPGKTELAPPEISDFALFATFVVFLHLPSRLFPLDCGDKANGRGTALAVPIPFRIRAIRETTPARVAGP